MFKTFFLRKLPSPDFFPAILSPPCKIVCRAAFQVPVPFFLFELLSFFPSFVLLISSQSRKYAPFFQSRTISSLPRLVQFGAGNFSIPLPMNTWAFLYVFFSRLPLHFVHFTPPPSLLASGEWSIAVFLSRPFLSIGLGSIVAKSRLLLYAFLFSAWLQKNPYMMVCHPLSTPPSCLKMR